MSSMTPAKDLPLEERVEAFQYMHKYFLDHAEAACPVTQHAECLCHGKPCLVTWDVRDADTQSGQPLKLHFGSTMCSPYSLASGKGRQGLGHASEASHCAWLTQRKARALQQQDINFLFVFLCEFRIIFAKSFSQKAYFFVKSAIVCNHFP